MFTAGLRIAFLHKIWRGGFIFPEGNSLAGRMPGYFLSLRRILKIVSLEWNISEENKPAGFSEIPGTETIIPCEKTFLAMGFLHAQHAGLLKQLDIELDPRGNVKATKKEYQTNISKIFTVGDMRRDQSLVVWAISEGRECARKVDEY